MIFICFLALKGEKKEIFVLINHFPTLEGAVCILDGCNTWFLAQLVPTLISDQEFFLWWCSIASNIIPLTSSGHTKDLPIVEPNNSCRIWDSLYFVRGFLLQFFSFWAKTIKFYSYSHFLDIPYRIMIL
jgi:hypothetical protein